MNLMTFILLLVVTSILVAAACFVLLSTLFQHTLLAVAAGFALLFVPLWLWHYNVITKRWMWIGVMVASIWALMLAGREGGLL